MTTGLVHSSAPNIGSKRIGPQRIDPVEILGILPGKPLPYFGWGDIPDQYRRRWDGDHGESSPPRDPGLTGLPPLRPEWGPVRAQPG
jgi:hypothetical protein